MKKRKVYVGQRGADNPEFIVTHPEGFVERNFGYPLLYGVPRSGMECNGGGLRATLFAMERSGIANNVQVYEKFRTLLKLFQ
jgi:hypothetical protein